MKIAASLKERTCTQGTHPLRILEAGRGEAGALQQQARPQASARVWLPVRLQSPPKAKVSQQVEGEGDTIALTKGRGRLGTPPNPTAGSAHAQV